jgi:transcriptional regulator with XRE-family HTH domain
MKFGDKLRVQRKKRGLLQEDVAAAIGVTKWTLANYEKGNSHPHNRSVYFKLADFFKVDVNYFLTEDEEFLTEAARKYGRKGWGQAEAILEQAAALFAEGGLSEKDQIAFLYEIQGLFLDSGQRSRARFKVRAN